MSCYHGYTQGSKHKQGLSHLLVHLQSQIDSSKETTPTHHTSENVAIDEVKYVKYLFIYLFIYLFTFCFL